MRIPIPTVQRQIDPRPANAGPMASGVPAYGVENLGASLFNVGANMQQAANIEADRAAREAAAKLERSEHEQRKNRVMERSRDDRLKWQETMQQRQTDAPEGADGFTSSALKDFDTYREEALKTVTDPEERAMYDGMLGSLREHIGTQALVFQAHARSAFRINSLTEGVEKSARLVTVDPSQMPDVLAQELALIRSSSDLTAEQKATLAERAKDTLSWAATQTLVDRSPDAFLERVGVRGGKPAKDGTPPKQDIEKAAAAVQGDAVLSQLPPARLQQAIDRATTLSVNRKAQAQMEADRARARAEAEANKREREAGAAYTVLRDMALAGRKIDPNNPENKLLMQQMQSVPAYAQAFAAAAEAVPATAAAAVQSLDVQRAQLNALYAQRNKQGTSPALEAEIKRRETVLGSAENDYRNEPLEAGADRGVLHAVAPVDTSTLDGIERGLVSRAPQADQVARKTGSPVSPLTNNEASIWADRINALSGSERGQRIAAMTATVGPQQAQALAAQIDKKDRALSLEIAVGSTMTTQGRTVGELIRLGAQTARDKGIKEDKAAETGLRASIAKEVGPMLNGQAREDVIDAARYIMLAKQAAGEMVSYQGAIELALGGPIIEHNGKRIPAPPQFTEERFQSSLASIKPQDIPARVIFTPSGATLTPAEVIARLPAAELEPAGTGRYYVRAPGGYLMGENRRPLPIEVR